jgi:hypothetical protein
MKVFREFIFFSLLIIILVRCESSCEEIRRIELHGVLISKEWKPEFKDMRNITIQTSEKTKVIVILPIDKRLFDTIVIGDSLYKKQNSSEIFIHRGNRRITYSLQCK